MSQYADSTGKPIFIGSRVRFRGQPYTIKSFGEKIVSRDVHPIYFHEKQHVPEVADEFSVDLMEEVKILIKTLRENIRELERKITQQVEIALKEAGVFIPYRSMATREEQPEGSCDDAQWFYINDFWDCPTSPFGLCMYHIIHDPCHDTCVFCGNPEERK